MTQETYDKIKNIYAVAKDLAEKYTCDPVMFNTGETLRNISDEYAKQINKTNIYRKQEADLQFLLTLLIDAKTGENNLPQTKTAAKKAEMWGDAIKALLKVYITIDQMQTTILRYYDKGGASF